MALTSANVYPLGYLILSIEMHYWIEKEKKREEEKKESYCHGFKNSLVEKMATENHPYLKHLEKYWLYKLFHTNLDITLKS